MAGTAATLVITLTLVLTGYAHAAEPFVFPETRAGEIAKDYFEALNSGDVDMWVACGFQLEAEEPHKLAFVMIQPTSPAEGVRR